MMKIALLLMPVLLLTACPFEENPESCNAVMVCEDDKEMLCQKNDSGCGEDCSYFTYEHCFEVCR